MKKSFRNYRSWEALPPSPQGRLTPLDLPQQLPGHICHTMGDALFYVYLPRWGVSPPRTGLGLSCHHCVPSLACTGRVMEQVCGEWVLKGPMPSCGMWPPSRALESHRRVLPRGRGRERQGQSALQKLQAACLL